MGNVKKAELKYNFLFYRNRTDVLLSPLVIFESRTTNSVTHNNVMNTSKLPDILNRNSTTSMTGRRMIMFCPIRRTMPAVRFSRDKVKQPQKRVPFIKKRAMSRNALAIFLSPLAFPHLAPWCYFFSPSTNCSTIRPLKGRSLAPQPFR